MNGWSAHPQGGHPSTMFRFGGWRGLHLMPDQDTPSHENVPTCWCGPVLVATAPINRWHHRASDGTEYQP